MKNITVSVPDEVYRRARVVAAEAGRSVSSMVTEYLTSMSEDKDAEFDRLLKQQDRVIRRIEGFSAGDRLSRDELHDRTIR